MTHPMLSAAIITACLQAWIPSAGAAERTEADFAKACTASSNLAAAICACSASKARVELTADGFALLVAMLEGDDKTAVELRSRLPIDQVMKAGTFMARGPSQCARE